MFANPESNVRKFGLTPNMHIADLGAGSGAYTIALAEILTNGKVYAVEVQKELLSRIKNDAEKKHLTNIEVIWGDIERAGGTKLGNSSMDGVLFDPPYSVEQCLRRYTPKQGGTAGRAEYWAKCKDEIKRICKKDAKVISFCWDSTGIGKKRGFEIIEILLICHGACHNDTIVTVERMY